MKDTIIEIRSLLNEFNSGFDSAEDSICEPKYLGQKTNQEHSTER